MYESSPVEMVHQTGVEGRPPTNPRWKRFLPSLVTVTVMALRVRKANPSSHLADIQIVLLGGLACATARGHGRRDLVMVGARLEMVRSLATR